MNERDSSFLFTRILRTVGVAMPMTPNQKKVGLIFGGILLFFVVMLIAYAGDAFDKTASVGSGPSTISIPGPSPSTISIPGPSPTVPPANQTKFIRIYKDLPPELAANPNNYTYQIGELEVYANGTLLPASSFSDVKYSTGGSYDANNGEFALSHLLDGKPSTWMASSKTGPSEITITLAVPTKITSLKVHNHPLACCKDQLIGVKVELMDDQGVSLWLSPSLTIADVQTLTPSYGMSSFQGFASSVSSVGQQIKSLFMRSAFQGFGNCSCSRATGCSCRASGIVSKPSTSTTLRNAVMLR